MATPLPQAQMMLPAGSLTCVQTRSWWFTHMTTSSAASPPWHSPRVAAYCWLATTISTAMSGTLWRLTVQVSHHTGQKSRDNMLCWYTSPYQNVHTSKMWLIDTGHDIYFRWVSSFLAKSPPLNETFFYKWGNDGVISTSNCVDFCWFIVIILEANWPNMSWSQYFQVCFITVVALSAV